MRFSSVLLAPVAAWTAAAAVIQISGRSTTTELVSGRAKAPTKMQAELISAGKKGEPKFTLTSAPNKEKKVTKRAPSLDAAVDELSVEKRANNVADLNEVKTGTSADTVGTKGQGPCIGIITTFDKVSKGKVDKIVAHLGAVGGPATLKTMVKAICSAAVGGGVWDTDLDAGYRPQIHVAYPDADAEVADMVKSGTISQAQAAGMKTALQNVISQVKTDLDSICSETGGGGHCCPKTRVGIKAAGSSMQASTGGAVTLDGAPF